MPFNRLVNFYEDLVLGKPIVALLLVTLILIVFAAYIPQFRLDVSADSLVLENDEDLEFYRNIRARYGSDDYLIVTYTPKTALFSKESLANLRHLRDRLSQIEHVESVTSMLDVPLLESPPIQLNQLRENIPTLDSPDTNHELARRELIESPLYRNRLLSPTGNTCAIQVMLEHDETYHKLRKQRDQLRDKKMDGELTAEERDLLDRVSKEFSDYSRELVVKESQVIQQVREMMDDYRDAADLHLGGVPMIAADMRSFIHHDLVVFGIAVSSILALMLAIVFRRVHWVLLPLLTATAVCIVTMGFLGMVGWPVTVVSSNFIALALIFSLSLMVHLIVRYREVQASKTELTHRELVSTTIRTKAAPCFFTVITTMVAFGSLVVSDIRPVIDFGWIMVFAMAASMVLSFTLFPASIMLIKPAKLKKHHDIVGMFLSTLVRLVERHSGILILSTIILVMLSLSGAARLSVENRFIDYFHTSTEIYQGMKLIDEELGGTTPLDVVIDAPAPEPDEDNWEDPFFDAAEGGITSTSYWFNPFMLDEVASIHNYLDRLQETGKVLSLHTSMTVLEKLDKDDMLDSFFLSILYKRLPPEVKSEMITPYLSQDGQQLRLAVRVFESDIGLNREHLINKIQAHLDEVRGQYDEKVHISGMVVLYNNLLQSLFSSQIQTLGVIFLAVLLTFVIVFKSFKVAAIAIIPNIVPAIFVFGLLGGLGIPLDIMTITIAAITVGISVDDTIHYIHRYHEEWKKDGDYLAAVKRSHNSIGRAMYYTTITVTTGFVVMVLSDFMPTIYFGVFTAVAMISALLVDLTLLPVLFRLVKPYGSSHHEKHA